MGYQTTKRRSFKIRKFSDKGGGEKEEENGENACLLYVFGLLVCHQKLCQKNIQRRIPGTKPFTVFVKNSILDVEEDSA